MQIAFFLEKENNPPSKEPAKEDLFKARDLPVTPTTTPVLHPLNVESSSREEELDARDLEMSKKVRRSYSRLETFGSASTSTPGRRSCFGFEGLLGSEELAQVSPVVCSKLAEAPRVPVKPWAPDTTLPGISPPAVKEKRKKRKVPEILVSEGQGFAPLSHQTCREAAGLGPAWGSVPAGSGYECSGQHAPFPLSHSPAPFFSPPRNLSWMNGLRP